MQWQTRRQNFLRLANLISSKNKLINDWSFSNGYNVYSLLLLLRNFWHTGDKKVIAILLAWRQSSPPMNPKSSRETQLAQLKKKWFSSYLWTTGWVNNINIPSRYTFHLSGHFSYCTCAEFRSIARGFPTGGPLSPSKKPTLGTISWKKAPQIQAASRNKQRTHVRKWNIVAGVTHYFFVCLVKRDTRCIFFTQAHEITHRVRRNWKQRLRSISFSSTTRWRFVSYKFTGLFASSCVHAYMLRNWHNKTQSCFNERYSSRKKCKLHGEKKKATTTNTSAPP